MSHAMPPSAIVVPADVDEPHRIIEWPAGKDADATLDVLVREVGEDCLDHSPILGWQNATLILWVGTSSLRTLADAHNDRMIALARHIGYDVPDLCGPVVITAGADPGGDIPGLDETLLGYLDAALASVSEASRQFRTTQVGDVILDHAEEGK